MIFADYPVLGVIQPDDVRAETRFAATLASVIEQEIGCAKGNHHGGGIGVARGDGRYDRRIRDAEPVDSVYAQVRTDDRAVIRSHAARADRVVDAALSG